ncbi:helix-turn-helix transcriptional regulator [Desulfosporosinus sp.]|uniref:helix-turn-helix domain-containing protein n=1 Tax=Desulfosporosinus sp. TaxID=157907 RepID=UPI002326A9CC|nr:helix-turn-helix transcriptional regulator [Desulfosporosinus sp.]MDA8224207.1 helix-turn-helix transcriptional regulator [Desulfitobacterium hafniense]
MSICIKENILETIQSKYSLNDSQLALKIGIDYSGLWRIKTGRNKPGEQFVAKILAAFPELTFEEVFFLEVESHGSDTTEQEGLGEAKWLRS